MKRREFLKTTVAAGIAGAAFGPLLKASNKIRANATRPDLVAVLGGKPVEMFEAGIKELGGMASFVKSGQTVVVKPNMAWARTPEYAATTTPELVAAVVTACYRAGARVVYVFDHTCNAWKQCYELSRIAAAAEKANAKVMPANSRTDYRKVSVPKGKTLTEAECHRLVLESDVLINVPILKNHGGAIITSAMKNLLGTVWDRRYFHRNGLQQCIADWVSFRKPDLNIIDAYHVMMKNGPRGRSLDDLAVKQMQLLSTDIVAADVAAAKIMGFSPSRVPHLKMGEELGLGVMDLDKLNIKRVNCKTSREPR